MQKEIVKAIFEKYMHNKESELAKKIAESCEYKIHEPIIQWKQSISNFIPTWKAGNWRKQKVLFVEVKRW